MDIIRVKRSYFFVGAIALTLLIATTDAFAPTSFINRRHHLVVPHRTQTQPLQMSVTDDETIGDDELLQDITDSMLQDLCKQSGITTEGTKQEMLIRLREFAQKQADSDGERRQRQKESIELGVDESQGNGKAKHKISNADVLDDTDDELDGVFYYSLPGQVPESQSKNLSTGTMTTMDKSLNVNPQNAQGSITAPPPPPGVEPNADGERVVTVYSSTDQNDLTGIAAQQASASANEQAMAGGYSRSDSIGASSDNPENTLAGGPFGDQSGSQRKKATDKQVDEACEVISDLVYSLLSMTGAPGFQEEFSEGITPFVTDGEKDEFKSSANKASSVKKVKGFVGFDPSRVPTQLITQSSRSLRVGNGDAIRKVLNEVEMQAIGFDGIHGDDKDTGGGHYREVTKVGTFLEGFRKAEVRRIARETATMLLDQLVTGGVKGLDQMLMTMTKGSDDASESGELNDSLVKYLDNAVRDQEKKVELLFGEQGAMSRNAVDMPEEEQDYLAKLWTVSTDEDGNTVESLDPNDPDVKLALEQELRADASRKGRSAPTDPAKQLLNLLTLLRERVKAEAVFSNDEKGRNLRMLAYCVHAEDGREREKIIVDTMGNSLEVSVKLHS